MSEREESRISPATRPTGLARAVVWWLGALSLLLAACHVGDGSVGDGSGDDDDTAVDASTDLPDPTFTDGSDALPALASGETTDVHLFDADGDGDLDILWANQAHEDPMDTTDVGLYLTLNGGGSFAEHRAIQAGVHWTFALTADLDGDGDADIVATRAAVTDPQVGVFMNDGSGTFSAVEDVPAIRAGSDGVVFGRAAVADLTGDGAPDIAVPIFADFAFANGMPNAVLVNDGAGHFARDDSRLPIVAPMDDFTLSLAAGDLDGDGDVDLFAGEANRRQRIFLNDSTGNFVDETETRIPPVSARGYRSLIADLEGDGVNDVVLIADFDAAPDAGTSPGRVFWNQGAGLFEERTIPSSPGGPFDSRALALGDVNGDGRADILIGNGCDLADHGGNAIEIVLVGGDGGLRNVPGPGGLAGKTIYGLAAGDLNGDGHVDLVAGVLAAEGGNLRDLLFWGGPSQ